MKFVQKMKLSGNGKWKAFLGFCLVLCFSGKALSQNIDRIEPPFWWTGMANPSLQLLVYGENIAIN